MNNVSKRAAAIATVCTLLGGGALAAGAFGATGTSNATTTSTTTTASAPTKGSNENATHEAGESAARETEEASGHFGPGPGGAFKPNTDPAHEKAESAARSAQEDAGQTPSVP